MLSDDETAARLLQAMDEGRPFILTHKGRVVAAFSPPDYRLVRFEPRAAGQVPVRPGFG